MGRRQVSDTRDGVELTNLDDPLFDDAGVTKRDLVDYLDAMSDRILPDLRDRPLSVIRARPGEAPFMQKNLPRYAPDWIARVALHADSSSRTIHYPLCHDRRTLLWLANQRAVEFHPTLVRGRGAVTGLVIDLDPPEGAPFAAVIAAARLVEQALHHAGLAGAVKTSGSKGVHIWVPLDDATPVMDAAAATRALAVRAERLGPDVATTAYIKADRGGKVFLDATRAGGASLVAAYSPRARPGLPVSFPIAWTDLDDVQPAEFTVTTVPALLAGADPWRAAMPAPQTLPADLLAEGHAIPVARVAAMHEGKRRKAAARRQAEKESPAVSSGESVGELADEPVGQSSAASAAEWPTKRR